MPSIFWGGSFSTERIETNMTISLFGFFPYEENLLRNREEHEQHPPSLPCPALSSQLVVLLLFGLTAMRTLLTLPGFNSEITVYFFFKEKSKYKA